MLKNLLKWIVPTVVIFVLLAMQVLGAVANQDGGTVNTAITEHSSASEQMKKPFSEAPSELASGLVKSGDQTETVGDIVQGRTTTFSDREYDPGPSGVVTWFRVQDANSNLKPIWEGKGWWLGTPELKTVQINGTPVTLEYNVDTGTFEGKPFQQTWLKGSWLKDGKEYQMLGINITVDDFVKMANSVQ